MCIDVENRLLLLKKINQVLIKCSIYIHTVKSETGKNLEIFVIKELKKVEVTEIKFDPRIVAQTSKTRKNIFLE